MIFSFVNVLKLKSSFIFNPNNEINDDIVDIEKILLQINQEFAFRQQLLKRHFDKKMSSQRVTEYFQESVGRTNKLMQKLVHLKHFSNF